MCPRNFARYSPVLASIPSSPVLGGADPCRSPSLAAALSTESSKASHASVVFSLYHEREAEKVQALESRLWISTSISLSLFACLLFAHFHPLFLSSLLVVPTTFLPSGPWATLLRLFLSFTTYLALLESFAYACCRISKLSSATDAISPAHATSQSKAALVQLTAILSATCLTNLPSLALVGYSLMTQLCALGLTTVIGALLVWDAIRGEQWDAESAEVEDEEEQMGMGISTGFVGVEFRRSEKFDDDY